MSVVNNRRVYMNKISSRRLQFRSDLCCLHKPEKVTPIMTWVYMHRMFERNKSFWRAELSDSAETAVEEETFAAFTCSSFDPLKRPIGKKDASCKHLSLIYIGLN